MGKLSESAQHEKILEVLLENRKLGIRQLIEAVPHLGQRALYKTLKILKRKKLIAVNAGGYRKLNYLTEKGLEEAERIVAFKTIQIETRALLYQDDTNKKLRAFAIIFKELFKVFCGKKWDLEEAKKWKKFCDIVELTAKDYLNENLPEKEVLQENRFGKYEDPYFALRSIDAYSLLEDALLAKQMGHCLTENHIDVLLRTKAVSSCEELEKHNVEWFKKHGIKERKNKFFEEEEERDTMLKKRGIIPMNRTRPIRWARDTIYRPTTLAPTTLE